MKIFIFYKQMTQELSIIGEKKPVPLTGLQIPAAFVLRAMKALETDMKYDVKPGFFSLPVSLVFPSPLLPAWEFRFDFYIICEAFSKTEN